MPDPVILIAGLMCDARLFLPQILHLAPVRAVMLIVPQGASIEEMSQAVLDAAPPRFALVGHGLGALVALDVLRRDVARVVRLALISADPLGESPQAATERDRRMLLAQTGRLAQAMRQEIPQDALAPQDHRDEVLALVEDMALDLGAAQFVAQSRALQRRRDQQKTLRRATMPALVLAGARDTLVPVRRQSFMADLMPNARVMVIDGAGHLPTLEQPEATSAALGLFLAGPLVLR